ncbi:MAG: PQQ-dependent sugar dehydrogenase, partial [Candidatus Rokuibacteriota bacterium]
GTEAVAAEAETDLRKLKPRRSPRRILVGFVLAIIMLTAGVVLFWPPRGVPAEAEVLARGLEVPWAVAEAPDGTLFVTERPGRVRVIDAGTGLRPEPVFNISIRPNGEAGLMGIALHPGFPSVARVFLMYSTYSPVDVPINRISRFDWTGTTLAGETVLLDGIPSASIHDGGRLAFGPDGKLYATAGDAASPDDAQDTGRLNGKILRINDDGSAPGDNPFATVPGAAEHVWSLGHRNPQGLAWHRSGALLATEHGPSGDAGFCCRDEVNLIRPGKNYGWPLAYGNDGQDGFERPVLQSGLETWAPAGAAFIGDDLYFGALRGKHVHHVRVDPSDPSKLVSHEKLYEGKFGRVRDAVKARDGSLIITTSNRDGRGQPTEGDDFVVKLRIGAEAEDERVAQGIGRPDAQANLLIRSSAPRPVADPLVHLRGASREVRQAARATARTSGGGGPGRPRTGRFVAARPARGRRHGP